jgi:3-phytase
MLQLISVVVLLTQVDIKPLRETASEKHQTDDPAVWYNRKNPGDSFILGTVKMAAPDGSIAVYKLDGSRLMSIPNVDRPNNIDVAYGLKLGARKIDVAIATERNKSALRVFEIVPGKGIKDLASLPVFAGQTGAMAQPMGIALYTRKRDKAIFAIVSRKSGPSGSYLWQYLLRDNGQGQLVAEKVREFGQYSNSKEIESVAIDPQREHVYYSDEGAGIRKYHADPSHPEAAKELALFANSGWKGDREGIAIAGEYIVATDQQHPNTEFHVFHRDTLRELGVFRIGADTTDGIDLSPQLNLFIAMNDSRHNFILASWPAIRAALKLKP